MTLDEAAAVLARRVRSGGSAEDISLLVSSMVRATGESVVDIYDAAREELGEDAHLLDELK